jgi:hypothetical protein
MRKILSILSFALIFLNSNIFAQGYFPLQKGNLWQYYETPWYPIETTRVLGDTILPNGNTYAVCSGIGLPGKFLRQVGAKVYCIDSQGNEFVLFDFAANVSDTISVSSTSNLIRLVEKGYDSGVKQNFWVFTSGNGITILTLWRIIDSLGIYQMMFEPGMQFALQGALIKGVVRYGTITSVSREPAMLPVGVSLKQNYPNPFNPSTKIDLILNNSGEVSLKILNMLGQEIVTLYQGILNVGNHSFTWNASNLSAGIYFCRLEVNRYVVTKKLMLIK